MRLGCLRLHSCLLLMAFALVATSAAAPAATLNVGDPAPPLKVGTWVQGEPVAKFEDGKIYVMEFWATWCGPCKATMPHLSELQTANPDVTFIAQSIGEEDKASSKVAGFVKAMGDKMNTRVATDDRSQDDAGTMSRTWLEAAGEETIPTTFVVNGKGEIAWIGRPTDVGPVIEQLKAGTYDMDTAKREAAAQDDRDADAQTMRKLFVERVAPLVSENDYPAAAAEIDKLIAEYPKMKEGLLGAKFGVLLNGKQFDEAYKVADVIAAENDDDAEQLNALAWTIVDGKGFDQRDYDRAEKYATRAAELTDMKEASILDTLARVYAEKGELKKAIELQTKAIEVANGALQAELQATLDAYKAKLN